MTRIYKENMNEGIFYTIVVTRSYLFLRNTVNEYLLNICNEIEIYDTLISNNFFVDYII